MTTDIKVLKQLTAIRLEVNIWSARRKLTPADFGSTDLPPEKLASLGSKRICDPAELRIFSTLKSRAVSLLDRVGVRFLGGWAVPENLVREIQTGLQEIAEDFESARRGFLSRYDDAVQAWIQDNPGWEALISRSVVNVNYVRSRLGFAWQMYRVVPPKKDRKVEVEAGLRDEVKGLGCTLFDEVSKAAGETWRKSYAGKTEITRKALSPLRVIHRKLMGLSFVEPRVAPVVELMETAFHRIPDKGRITGAELIMLQGLVFLLSDSYALLEHGQKIIEGRSADSVLDDLLKQPDAVVKSVSDAEPMSASMDDAPMDNTAPFNPDTASRPLDSLGLWQVRDDFAYIHPAMLAVAGERSGPILWRACGGWGESGLYRWPGDSPAGPACGCGQ